MYSWEITQVMEQYNYDLPSKIYLDMTENSPQINHVSYSAYNNSFEIWDKEGGYWRFAVHYEAA